MPRYIDAEKAIKKCVDLLNNADTCPNPAALEGIAIVKNLILSRAPTACPTEEVEKVMYCKNCKHYLHEAEYCNYLEDDRNPRDYCSKGERK